MGRVLTLWSSRKRNHKLPLRGSGCAPVASNVKLQMVWLLIIVALVLVFMGIDALDLAKYTRAPTDMELDEMFVGKESPPLPQASRDYVRNQLGLSVLVQFPQLVGLVFIVGGILCAVLAYFWHSSNLTSRCI